MLTIVSVFEDLKQKIYSSIGHLEFPNLSHIVDRPNIIINIIATLLLKQSTEIMDKLSFMAVECIVL